jgi:hypothetical protein
MITAIDASLSNIISCKTLIVKFKYQGCDFIPIVSDVSVGISIYIDFLDTTQI